MSIDDDIIILPEKKATSQGVRNKRKGSSIERLYATIMQEVGFAHCKTSRAASRMLDNSKVDLVFLPIHLQIKAGRQKGMKESEILKEMEILLRKNFPPNSLELSMPKAIVHHRDREKGRKLRLSYDTIVTMTFEDFLPLLLAFDKLKKEELK